MYEEFYGFSQRPFQLTPDPAFYFESLTHKKALSYLGYGLNQAEGFVVITGEVGAGKSTLVAHLRNRLDQRRMTVGEVVTSALDDAEMIHIAARSFGLAVEGGDKASALAAIELFLHEEARAGRRVLLIVDEAQNLSIAALEELRMLSNFQLGAHPLMQMLLLGQPEFKQLLAHSEELEQLRQRVIAAHHLEPMQPGEVEPYVTHRLCLVGWDGVPEFENPLWTRLHRASGGVPRKINQIMNRLLLLAAVEQVSTVEADMLESVLEEMQGDADAAADLPQRRAVPDRNLPAAEAVARARREESGAAPSSTAGLLNAQIAAIENAFVERDRALSALREEVAALGAGGTNAPFAAEDDSTGLAEKIERLETRLDEQEQSLRHVLAMMIDYFEQAGTRPAA